MCSTGKPVFLRWNTALDALRYLAWRADTCAPACVGYVRDSCKRTCGACEHR